MKYVSTRGLAPALGFEQAMLAGLARDGGLYVPESWPTLDRETIAGMAGRSFQDVAQTVLTPFVGDALAPDHLRRLIDAAYAGFQHPAVCPLVQTGVNEWILELHRGPTLAFKDVAMQLIGQLFDDALSRRGERLTIVGATSGDTGSAAIEAFRGRKNVDVFILYPHGRVSEVQRRQMTTPTEPNVRALAINGDFDDCQALVKAMFNDHAFRDDMRLGAVNSINWARVLAQTVYYFTAAVSLGAPHRAVSFSVPTGNFGDVFAGYVAKRMGLPIDRLIVATNENDILHRTISGGAYAAAGVTPTITPSMDIQVSSNFERLLYDLHDRDGAAVRSLMDRFSQSKEFTLGAGALARLQAEFDSAAVDQAQTSALIREVYEQSGYLLDPHTAVGLAAARRVSPQSSTPMVALATAHPAKFPDAVKSASGLHPNLPKHMSDLYERAERVTIMDNNLPMVENHIRAQIKG